MDTAQDHQEQLTCLRLGGSPEIRRVTLARPEVRNALNAELIAELTGVLRNASKEPQLCALVLSAEGNLFCAGGDFRWMSSLKTATPEENLEDARRLFDVFNELYFFPAPTVACVQGGAFGGGAGLVACCDYAVMAEDAVLSFSEVRIGLVPSTIVPFVLRKIGEGRAREVFLSGERIDAKRALQFGLVSRVVPATMLDAEISSLLDELKQCGPQAQRLAKRLVWEVADLPISQSRELMSCAIAEQRVTPEGQEGMAAFLEKRRPDWLK